MSNLLVIRGTHIGVRYELDAETTIGRAPDNDIQIPDPNISRLHCRVLRRGRSYRIEDAGSKNGIFVNGEQVESKTLLRNDEVVIGSTTFLFNTDHDLKNTRFSNKRVYFSSPTDETVVRLGIGELETPGPDAALSEIGAATNLLCQLGNLFNFELPLPDTLERILRTLLNVFRARHGCLMTWDPVEREFSPMVVISERESFTVSLNVIRAVLEEKKTLLVPSDKQGDDELQRAMGIQSAGRSGALCVPLLKNQQVTGLIYLEVEQEDQLLLHDIVLLQAVANMTRIAIEQAQEIDRLTRESREHAKGEDGELVWRSSAFEHVLTLVDKVADTDSTVLLTGETGTGKEMIAREVHYRSGRAKYPFCAINCAAIPENLIESELFGHERGAFTGADRMRRGLIETAHGGTLFLDEIGDMALPSQTKLLRFLQDRVVVRVGGHQSIRVDVRVIAATNTDLEKAVGEKRFREDLWYRINVFQIPLPPLRDRWEDVRPLAEHFLERFAESYHKSILGIAPEAVELLRGCRWPGNVRELQNAVERAVLLCDGPYLQPGHFHALRVEPVEAVTERGDSVVAMTEDVLPLPEVERRYILRALERFDWNQAQTARRLDIHRNTLRKKIKDYGLEPDKE